MAPQESTNELNEAEATKVVDLNIPQGDGDKEDEAVDEADKVSATATATMKTPNSIMMKKTSSIFSTRDGHTLEFDNIKLSTQSKNHEKNPPKQILKGISGNFPPKTLTAVMGPSGSGKTSLLKILTGRIGGSNSKLDLEGEIRLDYNTVEATDIDVRREIAYASFGAIANLLISTMFGVAQSSLTEFPKDRPVFLREYSTNHYSVLPYFLAKFSIECFTILCQVLVQQLAAFFLMGFQMNFFLFLMINFLLAIASTSIGIFIGSCVEDPGVAAELMPALIVPQLLFSGFFIPTAYIPSFLRWAQYACSLTYAIRLASLYEFGDCPTSACQTLLENNGVYELPSYWYWIILFCIAAIFRLTSMVILKRKATF
ncbi:ABC2_membrane-domain-containing protein [Fragilariopsis cylindrus CCMP1102]|uniref:ABC2_membrane-domain-containing protein n=1 Tax=Fragilariopsis cylindrus CCMP1102 TaxID=635003 RepID=A0A1E7F6S0_9STRA|nr:ABC2_membrane-domain-containing protein [Fragilariopsis cylindrus CCMP1102]|eukprot:OEU13882.1 ABC2_membrane-domain-containing protein [Fragilariopsis cylindrus CCMP1102]